MAKAKRVFQIAKELGVKSKDILRKCEAEGIPNITNHMSTVSLGLEETVRQWFGETKEGHEATAVETAPEVAVTRQTAVAELPKAAKAKKKARPAKAAEPEPEAPAVEPAEVPTDGAVEAPAADIPAEPIEVEEVAAEAEPALIETETVTTTADTLDAPTEAIEDAPVQTDAEPDVAEDSRAAAATADDGVSAPVADVEPVVPDDAEVPGEQDGGEPEGQKNVPRRPSDVAPAGPQLEEAKPAKLRGPRVVRIEQPDQIAKPTRRSGPPGGRGDETGSGVAADAGRGGPRTGRGPGGGGGGPGDGPPRHSRTKRRGAGGPGGDRGRQSGGAGGRGSVDRSKWREQDLREREARLSGAGGYFKKRRREAKRQGTGTDRPATAAVTGGQVKIQAPFTIKDLSSATGVKSADIIKKLFMQGVMTTVNSGIEVEQAQEIMMDWDIELIAEERKTAVEAVAEEFEHRDVVESKGRAPVVTILGHVDHGKTSLLDVIRDANVQEGEAGGITQATSAFRVPVTAGESEKQVVFLDTPGHEAFTSMRARGAQMTDIIVLVVAADDGVMPQTIESINHAKAADVPIIVALNKIDKPEATDQNIQRILGQLAEHGLNPVEWGGETEVVRTSAIKKSGIQDLLDTIDLQAQLLELEADFGGPARGYVIESRFEEGRGPTANVLIQDGRMRVGDFVVAGRGFGRVRDITNDRGRKMDEAGPATPVQISGLDELPDAGDKFYIVDSIKKAQQAAEQRRAQERELELSRPKVTLDNLFSQLKEGEVKEMLVVVKADVQGSVDVCRDIIEKISTDEVRLRVLHSAVGGINEGDVILAEASKAIIIGFNVISSSQARQQAEQRGVEIRSYQVVYDIEEDMRKAAEGLLAPELRQDIIGHAEVRQVFRVSKVGAVAGCYVTDGAIEVNAKIRVTRDDIVIENDRVLEQLKRFKDDAKEVKVGQECGMKIEGYDDIKEGDILECYRIREVKRTL